MARPGVIRDFVATKACPAQARTGERHQLHSQIVVGQGQLPPFLAPSEHGAGLHHQVVNRQMGSLHSQGLLQLCAPTVQRLVGEIADQIQAPARQCTAVMGLHQPPATLLKIQPPVATPQGFKHLIIKTLPSQTHPVDAGLDHSLKIGLIEAGGIHLQCDFCTGLKPELMAQRLQEPANLGCTQQRRRSPTDINSGQWWARGGQRDLSMELFEIGLDRGTAWSKLPFRLVSQGNHRKIAVKAAPMAKRNMQIGAARCGHLPRPSAGRWSMLPAAGLSRQKPNHG